MRDAAIPVAPSLALTPSFRERLDPRRSLSDDERSRLAARPDWTDAWAEAERRVSRLLDEAEDAAARLLDGASCTG